MHQISHQLALILTEHLPQSAKLCIQLNILQASQCPARDLLSSQTQAGHNACSGWQAMYKKQLSQLSANFPWVSTCLGNAAGLRPMSNYWMLTVAQAQCASMLYPTHHENLAQVRTKISQKRMLRLEMAFIHLWSQSLHNFSPCTQKSFPDELRAYIWK